MYCSIILHSGKLLVIRYVSHVLLENSLIFFLLLVQIYKTDNRLVACLSSQGLMHYMHRVSKISSKTSSQPQMPQKSQQLTFPGGRLLWGYQQHFSTFKEAGGPESFVFSSVPEGNMPLINLSSKVSGFGQAQF